MPFNKQISVGDPAVAIANRIVAASKAVKAAEAALGPAKKELVEVCTAYFDKDLPKVKAEIPTVFRIDTTHITVMPDGTEIESLSGEVVQAQVKVTRKAVSTEDSDLVMKELGVAAYDTLLVDELVLESVSKTSALQFALAHPELCTVTVSGSDSCMICITGADKIEGVVTKAVVMPVPGFLDAIRDLEAPARKKIMSVIKHVLDAGLSMAVALGNKTAEKANGK